MSLRPFAAATGLLGLGYCNARLVESDRLSRVPREHQWGPYLYHSKHREARAQRAKARRNR